jgi:hypothetical protein
VRTIIAIGDIHGDLDLAIRYLEIPQLIERLEKKPKHKDCTVVKLNYKNL